MTAAVKGAVGLTALALAGTAAFVVFGGSEYGPTPGVSASGSPSGSTARVAAATPVTADSQQLEPGPGDPVATDPHPANDGGQVSVALSYLGWTDGPAGGVEANGFVQGVVENGGTCTLTLVRGTATVTAHAEAQADASTTVCGGLLVPAGSLSPGEWQATLAYASAGAQGTSAATTVEVPGR